MTHTIKEEFQVSPSFLFFLIHSVQIGVGILGFQRYIIKGGGHDAWIAVIASGLSMCVLLWMCFHILKRENTDIVDIHRVYFGKFIGNILNVLFSLYFFTFAITIYRTYIEVLQVWMFPNLATWFVSLAYLPLIYYVISGGFRTITGIAFFGVVLPLPLFFSLFYPLYLGEANNLLPFLDHSLGELFTSFKTITFGYLGFETILFFYPYIKSGSKSQKWGQAGILFTTFMYAFLTIVSFVYFSQGQLKTTIWPTLTMAKIIEIPFIQRFEYIVISLWLLVVLPAICISLWCTVRGLKRTFNGKSSIYLLILIVILLVFSVFLDNRKMIDQLNNNVSRLGMYVIYFYIPFLFLFGLIRSKIQHKKQPPKQDEQKKSESTT
ncbi:GerAB/ArcD/ProY family transporter [Priestia megaterium]|nr:GerAB/ArcD/ProY family transporter [Priestia megaterium]